MGSFLVLKVQEQRFRQILLVQGAWLPFETKILLVVHNALTVNISEVQISRVKTYVESDVGFNIDLKATVYQKVRIWKTV